MNITKVSISKAWPVLGRKLKFSVQFANQFSTVAGDS